MQRLLPYLTILVLILFAGCQREKDRLPEEFDLQGHRGAMGLKPENTLPGFYKAVDLGVTTIEFDLAVSKEHKLVISHEPWFRSNICLQPDGSPIPRDEERSFRIYELDYESIAQFDCGSLQHPSHPEQKNMFASKPLMIDAIVAIDEYVRSQARPPIRYNIETKSNPAWYGTLTPEPEVFARLVFEEFLELEQRLQDGILDRVSVQSFDPHPLQALREIAPGIPIAILTSAEGSVDAHIEYFGFLPEIYSPQYRILTQEHVDRAQELGMLVIPYTINRPEDMKRMVELGVDGLITDYPDRFNELFPSRRASIKDLKPSKR